MDKRTVVINRRRFLAGSGILLPIPFMASLETRAARKKASSTAVNKRFICIAPEYGIHRASLIPTKPGPLSQLPKYAQSLNAHRRDFSIFSGIDHPMVGGGHAATSTLLNGMKKSLCGGDLKKMLSLDMYLADKFGRDTRFPLLTVGNGSAVTFNNKGVAVPKIESPEKLFAKVFQQDNPKEIKKREQSLNQDLSILDNLVSDAKFLGKNLDKTDREKFEEYLTSLRATEQRLHQEKQWLYKEKPKPEFNPFEKAAEMDEPPHRNDLFLDIIALALQTDSTRFVTFQMPGGNGFLPVEGVNTAYHTLTHHGHRPDRVGQLSLIDQWRYKQLANFLDKLKKMKDGNGRPLLDTTLLMFASGMSDASNHSSKNNTVLFAGGGLKHGKHHALKGTKDGVISNLYVTCLNYFGLREKSFATSRGNLNHLLS
ncbi:hypothetical protein LNTAR_17848 [Lentisphaera araneosa HTCC2155]|uniref:Secreted protein containing DUF1552 n=1 Tax=Lentisphaera araneosa HTCC2155 TaxID=313628 RepID=A6DFQ8_9BACT|nr:DUF1552 domain-containing protein [Lentisphaera araneosa]EDM29638.1 hypothetical protein LNTAR_17848 [Lentisphaera araneosa HTCC2155]